MNILLTICARGGSVGVKDKNIREINKKPLIAYTIDIAKRWQEIQKYHHNDINHHNDILIVCSTDSQKIADVAKKYGAQVPFLRPKNLATNTAGKVGVIRHATIECEKIYNREFDLIVDLDVTSPIRTIEDLDSCFKIYQEKNPEILFSVVEARKNPYFNMVEEKEDGFVKLAKTPKKAFKRRQDLPRVYDMNASIYFYNKKFLMKKDSVTDSDRIAVHVMDEISAFDVDCERDFKFIEYLIKEKIVAI